eukprot:3172774-Amphidinium_carterae.1
MLVNEQLLNTERSREVSTCAMRERHSYAIPKGRNILSWRQCRVLAGTQGRSELSSLMAGHSSYTASQPLLRMNTADCIK